MSEMSAAEPPAKPLSTIERLDESLKELKDELQCPLCLDFYRDPVALPCQHSFCRECVVGLVRPQGRDDNHGELECPLCRKKIQLDGRGVVECLPRNFHLGEIVGKFHEVETRLDVMWTEQLEKQQLEKNTSEPEQQQPDALHHQDQHEEPTGNNEQFQQDVEPIRLRQRRFHQVDGLHSSNDNKPIRANCAQPADIREHQEQQHRRQAGLGQQQLPSEVSQHGELVQTVQEHLHDSFRQMRAEQHNQQRVLHQQLGQQREEQQGYLHRLHDQLHQQRQQQQKQQQMLNQQLGQQREGQKRYAQQLQQQLRQQRQQLQQQLGQQREGQKRNAQQLQQQLREQRQQQQNQQQMLHQQLGQQRERQKRNAQQLQQQLRQQSQQLRQQSQQQHQQQQQGQRRARQQQREHYHL